MLWLKVEGNKTKTMSCWMLKCSVDLRGTTELGDKSFAAVKQQYEVWQTRSVKKYEDMFFFCISDCLCSPSASLAPVVALELTVTSSSG